VRKATLECAQRAAQEHSQAAAQDYRSLPQDSAPTIIAEADGSMLCIVSAGSRTGKRPRRWEEIRLAAAQVKGQKQSVYAATFGDVNEVGRRWGHCAKAAGRQLGSPIHCVGDGAEWISRQSRKIFGTQGSYLCDYYHVSEYLAAAAPTCRSHAPQSWRRTQQRRLKRGAIQLVVKELGEHCEGGEKADEEAPVRAAHRYLSNRLKELDYVGALAKELPIGSGLIESGHKHVLQARLKLAGCAWLKDNASDMAQLRVLRANGQWAQLWN